MWTATAPSYANLFMVNFKESYIYSKILKDCLIYVRYIDDTFFIYTETTTQLQTLFNYVNTVHDTIKFDCQTSTDSIASLDTNIYFDSYMNLQTTLNTKPTDTHNFQQSESCHPKHLKENLPFSQLLRIRRICSTKDELEIHNRNLLKYFTAKGYSQKLISKQIFKASTIPREHTLTFSTKMKLNRIPMITAFHDRLPPLSRIINKRMDVLTLNAQHKNICKEPFVVAFRRPKNISDLICSNKIINNTVFHKISPPKTIQFWQPGNIKNSLCCKYVTRANSFTSRVTQISYNIVHSTNCQMPNSIHRKVYITLKLQTQ